MRKQAVAAALAIAFAFPIGAGAQSTTPSTRQMMEAVATVTSIDPSTRTVRVQTPKGETVVAVSPEIKLEDVQIGARYRVRYSEPVVVAIEVGAPSAAAGGATAQVEPKAGAKGSEGVKTASVGGTVDTLDPASGQLVVRATDGSKQAFRLPPGTSTGPLKPGLPVTLTYMQAVATQMASTPQPVSDPAPAQ